MGPEYLLAWLLPAFAGAGLLGLVETPRGGWAVRLGTGWLVGLFLAAQLASWTAHEDTRHAFALAAPWLTLIGAVAWFGVWRRRARSGALPMASIRSLIAPTWATALCCALLALILWRLWTTAAEALLLPVFPWDAWSSWAVKPKTWFGLGSAVAYVPVADWLTHPGVALRTDEAWGYPDLLAWIELWFASAAGGWIEPLVDLAWTGALAALLLAAYGQWRALRLAPWLALALVYALASLPLVDAHAALAGYADLWLAATFGLTTLAWTRWLVTRERGQLLIAVALALCLPAVKLEGAVWMLAFFLALLLAVLPPRWRLRVVIGVLALIATGLALGGFSLPILGLGWVRVAWGQVTIPAIGTLYLRWHAVGGALLKGLFTLPNWHLLWYLAPALVAARWRNLRRDDAAKMAGALMLLCLAFLFVLFFFTDAAVWAQDYTSSNRLVMQMVPALFAFLALLLRGVGEPSGFPARASVDPVRVPVL